MKPITGSLTILEQIRSVTDVVDNWKTKGCTSEDTVPKYNIEKFNNLYNSIQDGLTKITDTPDVNIEELQAKLKTLFENLTDLLFGQSKQIIELENRMTKLEKKFKMMEKNKVIADLLDPFVKVGDRFEVTIISLHIMFFLCRSRRCTSILIHYQVNHVVMTIHLFFVHFKQSSKMIKQWKMNIKHILRKR